MLASPKIHVLFSDALKFEMHNRPKNHANHQMGRICCLYLLKNMWKHIFVYTYFLYVYSHVCMHANIHACIYTSMSSFAIFRGMKALSTAIESTRQMGSLLKGYR